METWRPIMPRYEVSDRGRVRSSVRSNARIIKQRKATNGYMKVNLYVDGKPSTLLVHRLVAMAFIDNPERKSTVNHLDRKRRNNVATNLEWVTVIENNAICVAAGRRHALTNPKRAHKLTAAKAAAIRKLAADGVRSGLIAEKYDITTSTVRHIVTGKLWSMP